MANSVFGLPILRLNITKTLFISYGCRTVRLIRGHTNLIVVVKFFIINMVASPDLDRRPYHTRDGAHLHVNLCFVCLSPCFGFGTKSTKIT